MASGNATTTPTNEGESSGLFWHLAPGLLLIVLVAGVMLSRWQRPRTPHEEIVQILSQPNPVLRQQALAGYQNRLRNDLLYAGDPEVAVELLARLDRLLVQSTPQEEAFQRRLPGLTTDQVTIQRNLLRGDREYLQELLATLPCSLVPVGLPLLCELAEAMPAMESEVRTARRKGALHALSLLGESVQRAQKIAPPDLDDLVRELQAMPASGRVQEGLQAGARYLNGVGQGQPDIQGLDATLARCAGDADPVVREGAAFAARWWHGTPKQNEAIDAALVRLLEDDGRNETAPVVEKGAYPRLVPPPPGFRTRAHAVLALAWRGSAQLPLARLSQLLDLDYLQSSLRVETAEGKSEPNQPAVQDLLHGALRALLRLHEKDPARDLNPLLPSLKKLAESPEAAVRVPAEQVRQALQEKAQP